jgi:type II secretory ATPase GspE/PulE/Tfp pilus assembly ATPase PilB-like protein
VPHEPDPADLLAIGIEGPLTVKLVRGMGCAACRGTGYRGRVGIYEMFAVDEDARSLIMKQVSAGELRRHAMARGMVTLRADGWAKACEGLTTVDEILRVTQEDD